MYRASILQLQQAITGSVTVTTAALQFHLQEFQVRSLLASVGAEAQAGVNQAVTGAAASRAHSGRACARCRPEGWQASGLHQRSGGACSYLQMLLCVMVGFSTTRLTWAVWQDRSGVPVVQSCASRLHWHCGQALYCQLNAWCARSTSPCMGTMSRSAVDYHSTPHFMHTAVRCARSQLLNPSMACRGLAHSTVMWHGAAGWCMAC